MPEKNEVKEEKIGSKKNALSIKDIFANERQSFKNPIIEEARNSLNHHGISKKPNLRFFKSISADPIERKIYLNISAHKSLSYSERFTKEVGAGIAIGITKIPISMALINLEKRLYPLGTPPHLLHNKSFRLFARFGAPITEELIFRGALLYGLHTGFTKLGIKDTHAATASSVVNSLIFSAIHSKGMRLHTFVGGMIYSGMTYYCDGSLVPAITSHMTNNNIATSLTYRRLRR